jgi:GTPase SAR1 family protein
MELLDSGASKCLVVGDQDVGKTSLIQAFASCSQNSQAVESDNTWFEIHDPQQNRPVSVGLGGRRRFHFWECSLHTLQSQKGYDVLEGSSSVIIVYDISNYDTFVSASTTWMSMVRTRLPEKTFVVLIGLKMDLTSSRRVTIDEAQLLASRENMLFMEVSSRNGTNIQRTLTLLASKPVAETPPPPPPPLVPATTVTTSQVIPGTISSTNSLFMTDPQGDHQNHHHHQHEEQQQEQPRRRQQPVSIRTFSQPAQVSTSYDSINAILGRSSPVQEEEEEGQSYTNTTSFKDGDSKSSEKKMFASDLSSSSHLSKVKGPVSPNSSPSTTTKPNVPDDFTSPNGSPPRALFAQEYDTLKELFNSCGFEATDGFLQHVQQQRGNDRSRLKSITGDVSFNEFMNLETSPRPNLQQFPAATTAATTAAATTATAATAAVVASPNHRAHGFPSTSLSQQEQQLSTSNLIEDHLNSKQHRQEIMKVQKYASESKKSKFRRQWGQHIVPGSDDDKTSMERVQEAAAIHLRGVGEGAQFVPEVDDSSKLLIPGVSELLHNDHPSSPTTNSITTSTKDPFHMSTNTTISSSKRRPDFFLDIHLPDHGSEIGETVKLPIYMDVHPKKLARNFVEKYNLKFRRIPKLTDEIEIKMKKYREESKRKRFAMHLHRRRNFLARWKTPMSASSPAAKGTTLVDRQDLETKSRGRSERSSNTKTSNDVIRPIIGKLHVNIADAKKTILIREGDTADELASRFSHRYGLKRRDTELVRERIGRQIYAYQRDQYGSGDGVGGDAGGGVKPTTPVFGVPTNSAKQNSGVASEVSDFPSNLTPSQRKLLMMTLGKGVEMHTPWRRRGEEGGARNASLVTPSRRRPILRMQIDISGTPSSLTVHEGDDVVEIATKFVNDHNLPETSVDTISKVIIKAVKEERKRMRRSGGKKL